MSQTPDITIILPAYNELATITRTVSETLHYFAARGLAPEVIVAADGTVREVVVTLRIDTPIEVDYYRAGGILPFVLRQLLEG